MKYIFYIFLIFFIQTCLSERVIFESRQRLSVPHDYEELPFLGDRASEPLQLLVALKQRNLPALQQILYEVSTPRSPRYGQHLSAAQVAALTAPLPSELEFVAKWFAVHASASASPHPKTDDFLRLRLSLADAERAFRVSFRLFRHRHTGERFWRTLDRYSLPSDVAPYVDFVSGMHRLPRRWRDSPPQPRAAPLPPGNSPLISYLYPSSQAFTVFFAPRCSDGSPLTPASASSAQCGISGYSLSASYGVLPTSVSTPFAPSACRPCASWRGKHASACQSTAAQYALPSDAVFCQSPLFTGFPNYLEISPAVSALYASGAPSLPGVWPDHRVFLGEFMSPAVLRARYGVPDGLYGAAPGNSMAVAEFLGQYYSPDDLQAWFKLMGLPPPAQVPLIGPNNATQPGGEASLDIQYIMGIAPNITCTFWSLGQLTAGQEPFLDWITDVLNDPNAPLVHSVSYADDESSLSLEYMARVDAEFVKAGARGLTVLFAAGDNGVAASDPSTPGCPGRFVPSFPSSSPHVTAVSGTQWSTQAAPLCNMTGDDGTLSYQCSQVQEIASSTLTGSRISTGGGFSDVFPRPAYQDAWVKGYLGGFIDRQIPATWFNASGRCYGDISSSARNYPTLIGGDLDAVDGTSAATPTIAALIALVNDLLLQRGAPPVGFINPALYAMPNTAFFDVVMGNNRCPEDLADCCPYGYNASPFYDPLSGRGTPHFHELFRFFSNLSS